jgi:hypothetical protein
MLAFFICVVAFGFQVVRFHCSNMRTSKGDMRVPVGSRRTLARHRIIFPALFCKTSLVITQVDMLTFPQHADF